MGGYTPSDVAQEALDAAGVDFLLGNIEDGDRNAQVLLRKWEQCLKQLLRSANWDFARREAPLQLLADASGQTANVGSLIVGGQYIYEYAYPPDAMKIRYIPWGFPPNNLGAPAGNITPPSPNLPLVNGLNQPPALARAPRPARFVISNDVNYPPPPGQILSEVQGQSPVGRAVILTNVQNALAVYTCLVLYPSVWDSLFRGAFVAYLASEIALPLAKDKKFGLAMRKEQIAIAKDKIIQARLVDGNEGVYSSDIKVDWMETRFTGGRAGWRGAGPYGNDGGGWLWGGWDDCCGAGSVSAY